MGLKESLRDHRALVLRLIVAEALAKRGEGPLAPRYFQVRPEPGIAPAPAPEPQPEPEPETR